MFPAKVDGVLVGLIRGFAAERGEPAPMERNRGKVAATWEQVLSPMLIQATPPEEPKRRRVRWLVASIVLAVALAVVLVVLPFFRVVRFRLPGHHAINLMAGTGANTAAHVRWFETKDRDLHSVQICTGPNLGGVYYEIAWW